MKHSKELYWIWLVGLLSALTVSCSDGGSASSGSLSVGVTDAPVNYSEVEEVVVNFTGVTIKGPQGEVTYAVTDPVNPESSSRSIDLLALSGGKSVVLFDQSLKVGKYNWLRLDTDPSKTYITVNGLQYALRCSSCEQNGFKLNRSFRIDDDGVVAFTIDFDLNKSITDPQSGDHYELRPTARVVENASAGNIAGTVSDTVISGLYGEQGEQDYCAVYVYAGDVAPDDIYLPESGTPSSHVNPVSTARVAYDGNTESYRYTAGFLPAGQYSVALTCDTASDDIIEDNAITFYGPDTVAVIEQQTTVHNFEATSP
jgi:hypothetical protein